ncbi:MAG: tetratricopeptide repeat protein [Candidatus Kapaibacterium sp.]
MSNLEFNSYFDDESPDEMNKRIRRYRRAVQNRSDSENLPSPDIIEDLVNYCIDNDKYVEALEFCSLWIEYYPSSNDAWVKKGMAALNLSMFETAVSSFERALHYNPNDAEILIYKADALENLDELILAEDTINTALRIDPSNDEAFLILGNIYQKKGNYEEAVKVYSYLINNDEFKRDVLQEIAFCYTIIGDYKLAIENYNLAIDEDPYDFELWFNLGIIYSQNEQFNKALDAYDMVLAIQEDFYPAIVQKADSYSALGKLAEAITWYETALVYTPKDKDVMQQLAGAYADNEDFGKAINLFTKIIGKHPYNYQAYFGRGVCLDALEQFEEAIKDYNRALEFNKNVVELWYAKGDTHYNLTQRYDAVDSYKKVIELDPFNFECMEDLGRLYIELDSLSYAEEILLECASLSPNHANAYYLLGKIKAFQKMLPQAAQFISDAIKLDLTISEVFEDEKQEYLEKKVDLKKLTTLIIEKSK